MGNGLRFSCPREGSESVPHSAALFCLHVHRKYLELMGQGSVFLVALVIGFISIQH